MLSVALALVLATPLAGASTCDEAALYAQVNEARAAFFELDEPRFVAARTAVEDTVACMEAPISPALAAEVHGVVALDAFLAQNEDLTLDAFHAARAASSDFDPRTWTSDTHSIHFEWRFSGRLEPDAPVAFADRDAVVVVDGRIADGRIPTQPAILQKLSGDEVVEGLLWVPPGTVPTWAEAAARRMEPAVRRRIIWGSATALSAIGTGVLLGFASNAHEQYVSGGVDYADLGEAEGRLQALNIGAIAAASTTLGLGTVLVVRW